MTKFIVAGCVAGLVGGLVVLGGMRLQQRRQGELQQAEAQRAAQAAAVAHQRTCYNNLLMIESATAQWALENNKGDEVIPTPSDLGSYIPGGFPTCPEGGSYRLVGAREKPACSIANHSGQK